MGLAEATKKDLYLQKFVSELGFDDAKKIEIGNNNQGAHE